jgi:hypothetical protein
VETASQCYMRSFVLSGIRSAHAPLVATRTLMGRSDFMMLSTFCVAACHVCIGSALLCRVCCHIQVTCSCLERHKLCSRGSGQWSSALDMVMSGASFDRHTLFSWGGGTWSSASDMVMSGAT